MSTVDNSPLTAQDRCDRCGAQAKARTAHDVSAAPNTYEGSETVVGPRPLLWCAHHFKDHSDILTPLLVWQTPEIAQSRKEPVTQS